MKRIAGLLVMVAIISGCAGMQKQPTEGLNWFMPKEYSIKFAKDFTLIPREMYLTRCVFEGDSIENWTEAVEVVNSWRKNFPSSIDNTFQGLIEIRKKNCPEVVVSVISKDSNSILYEAKTVNCPPNPDENAITRILLGNSDFFSITYINRAKELPKEKRDEWIKELSKAKIEVR